MTDLLEIVESPNKHNSCTLDENKEAILQSSRKENGEIRILVATIAFAINCAKIKYSELIEPINKEMRIFVTWEKRRERLLQ